LYNSRPSFFYRLILYLYLHIQNLNCEIKIYFTAFTSPANRHFKDFTILSGIHRAFLQQLFIYKNCSFFENCIRQNSIFCWRLYVHYFDFTFDSMVLESQKNMEITMEKSSSYNFKCTVCVLFFLSFALGV